MNKCKHDYELIDKTIFKSPFESMMERTSSMKFDLTHDNIFYRSKVVYVFKCKICKEHDPDKINEDLQARGIATEVVRLPHLDHDLDGTRKIISKVIDWWTFQKKMETVEKGDTKK